jgi:hypothetical protein
VIFGLKRNHLATLVGKIANSANENAYLAMVTQFYLSGKSSQLFNLSRRK